MTPFYISGLPVQGVVFGFSLLGMQLTECPPFFQAVGMATSALRTSKQTASYRIIPDQNCEVGLTAKNSTVPSIWAEIFCFHPVVLQTGLDTKGS